MDSTIADLTWITFLRDIGIIMLKPPELLFDNISVLHMAKNLVFRARTNHI